MIHSPSRVACNPLGCGPGDVNTICGLATLRRGTDDSAVGSAANADRLAADAGTAAASPRNARRLSMGSSFGADCSTAIWRPGLCHPNAAAALGAPARPGACGGSKEQDPPYVSVSSFK